MVHVALAKYHLPRYFCFISLPNYLKDLELELNAAGTSNGYQ